MNLYNSHIKSHYSLWRNQRDWTCGQSSCFSVFDDFVTEEPWCCGSISPSVQSLADAPPRRLESTPPLVSVLCVWQAASWSVGKWHRQGGRNFPPFRASSQSQTGGRALAGKWSSSSGTINADRSARRCCWLRVWGGCVLQSSTFTLTGKFKVTLLNGFMASCFFIFFICIHKSLNSILSD